MENYNEGDYTALIDAETNIFNQNIEILKGWRDIFWETSFKGTSAFVAPNLGNICSLKQELTSMKKFVNDEVFKKFIKEYDMTIFLINKCLIKSIIEQLLPTSREDNLKIEELISKTTILIDENDNLEETIEKLRKEDPTTRKTFESMGLPKEKIEKIVASGYKVDSVLDVELKNDLRK